MLEFFLHRTKGSITIMVTLMLIPTIFFTGFLTDLARIKLYSNQAVMAADNYGEAIIAEYDNLLKEMYGLFAITQDTKGQAAITDLQNYMKTSFDPTQSTIKWDHLGGKTGLLNGSFSGFMPYQSASITLSEEYVESSKLSNPAIMSTQIGDFMRFRIVQELTDSDGQDTLLEALDEVQKTGNKSKILTKKSEFDKQMSKVLDEMNDYYKTLKRFYSYPEYIKNINTAYDKVKSEFSNIKNSYHYKTWREYMENEEEINVARQVPEENRTQDDIRLIEIGNAYDNDSEARTGKLLEKFDSAIETYEESKESTEANFENFEFLSELLYTKAKDVENAYAMLNYIKDNLEEELNGDDVSQEMKEGIQEDIDLMEELYGGEYSGENYINLANCIKGNVEVNSNYERKMQSQIYQLESIRSDYLDITISESDYSTNYKQQLNVNEYNDFTKTPIYKKLYDSLVKTFEYSNNSSAEGAAKDKKDNAENVQQQAEEEMEKDKIASTGTRDIPSEADFANIGDTGTGGGFSVDDLIKTASNYFELNSFSEAGNKLLLKFYVVAYDFGMFSSRTTNIDSDSEKAVSLTGIEMSKSVNYLYQAEIEYLYGGHKSSDSNLEAARNHILSFRAVVNMASTYEIDKVNKAIKAVRNSLAAINPALGIAAAAALRAGFTAVETAADWQLLKKGETVVLNKKELGDLSSKDAIASLLGISISDSKSDNLALDYDQYMMVLLTFLTTSDQIIQRTSDLITLNVNTVKNNIGEGTLTSLDFKMDNAYTAVNATCSVQMNMVVMPKGFAQKTIDSSTYGEVETFDNNIYKFTVTRGY